MSGFLAWLAGSGVVQGLIMGLAFAYLTTVLILNDVAKTETKTVNGWSVIRNAGHPGNGLLVRGALQKALPVVNVFEKVMRRAYLPGPAIADGRYEVPSVAQVQ